MLVFLTLTQIWCQRGALLKIQMDCALFIYIYFTHGTQPSGTNARLQTETQGDVGAQKRACLWLHKHTNAHKDNRFSTVTHLKHIWEWERERESTHSPTYRNFQQCSRNRGHCVIPHNHSAGSLSTSVCMYSVCILMTVWVCVCVWRFSVINRTVRMSALQASPTRTTATVSM